MGQCTNILVSRSFNTIEAVRLPRSLHFCRENDFSFSNISSYGLFLDPRIGSNLVGFLYSCSSILVL